VLEEASQMISGSFDTPIRFVALSGQGERFFRLMEIRLVPDTITG
jgi:hypothetical protein